ncbi:MAG TPA: hypothetical protein RMF84_00835, partial [Polyangiaceae bacterium LLY-WYZ-14_1]|nr:hypothetical protein [Polyangiaceae bacterium LLY-WYZ-14_1]
PSRGAEAASAARRGDEEYLKDISRSRNAADGVGSASRRPERYVERPSGRVLRKPSASSDPKRTRLRPFPLELAADHQSEERADAKR